MKQLLAKAVAIIEEKAPYASALYRKDETVRIRGDKDVFVVNTSADEGVKLRAWNGKYWQETACSGSDSDIILQHAKTLASQVTVQGDTTIPEEPHEEEFRSPSEDVSLKEKIAFIKDLQKKLMRPNIVNAIAVLIEEYEERIFVSSKRKLSSVFGGTMVIILPYIKAKDDSMRYYYHGMFDKGFSVTKKVTDELLDKLYEHMLNVAKADKIKSGKYDAILSPQLAGLLAHESFGHGMEADTLYKGRGLALDYVGKKIAPEYVSIIDNPSLPHRHGSFFFDDEGVIAKPTYLIKDGVVGNPLTDIYNAAKLRLPQSANARAESYDHKSYARMSNTYFAPGDAEVADMITQLKDGYFLHSASGGMEDPKGWGVQIQGVIGERVKDGKLTGEYFYEAGMTGYLPSLLKNIELVGKELEVDGTGTCGKGHKEWVRVSEGGPHLLIRGVHLL